MMTMTDPIPIQEEERTDDDDLLPGVPTPSFLRGSSATESEDEVQPLVIRIRAQRMPRLHMFTFSTSFNSPSSLFSSIPSPSVLCPSLFHDNMFGGLFDNRIADIIDRMRLRMRAINDAFAEQSEEPEEEEDEEEDEDTSNVPEPYDFGREEEEEREPLPPTRQDAEDLKKMSDEGFLEADWGVNAAELRDACALSFEDLCPASVPAVFSEDIYRYPPPGVPMTGLAPVDSSAPCWMDCVKKNYDELPYECQVAADRMKTWIDVHGDEVEYIAPPQALFLGMFLHFLVLTLIILTCVRCTVVFCRLRRKRQHAIVLANMSVSQDEDEKGAGESSLPVVKAITIQVPRGHEEGAVTVVRGTVVSA